VVAVKGDGKPIKNADGTTVSQKYEVQIPSLDVLYSDVGNEIDEQVRAGTLSQEVSQPKIQWLNFAGPAVLVVSVIIFLLFLTQNQAGRGANAFTKSRARLVEEDNKRKMKFDDVAGADEEKAELAEIVDFLKNPSKFTALGARIPKGVLLVGSPGTGKTLLARAVAGEAGVPYFSISGSDFVELYVGVGAARVRDLFEQAKKSKPCIIFIDEIDAVGRKRGAGMGGGHDEREQTLNQLLVEMDGFGVNEGIIMIAATNRPDILDPALLRPGRFDRQVVVDVPDVKGREEILKIHSRKKPLAGDVDLKQIAKSTAGYTGADLENLMNEAAIFAARRGRDVISKEDMDDANIKVMIGTQKKSRVITEKEKRLTAFHEAGHAVIARLVDDTTIINQVSIIPRGRAGGYTMYLPEDDHMYVSKTELMNKILIALGGRAAEQLVIGDISTGASSDIHRATEIAQQMVAKYGMSEKIGTVSYDSHEEVFIGRDFAHSKAYSEKTAAQIDDEVSAMISERYKTTLELLKENMDTLTRVAEELLEKETIDHAEFEAVFNRQ
jgi:cell division protease FtsH